MRRQILVEALEVVPYGKLDVNRIEIEVYHSKDEKSYVLTVNPYKHGEHFKTYIGLTGIRAQLAPCKRFSQAEMERQAASLDKHYVAAMINRLIEKHALKVVSSSRFPLTNYEGKTDAA